MYVTADRHMAVFMNAGVVRDQPEVASPSS